MLSTADMRLPQVGTQCFETRMGVAFGCSPSGWRWEVFEIRRGSWSQTLGWFALALAARSRLAANPHILLSSSTASRQSLRHAKMLRTSQDKLWESIDEA
jgi:hypothetical protein